MREPGFLALCEELADNLTDHCGDNEHSWELIERARAALDTPLPKPPTDEEIDRCIEHWKELCNYPTTRDRFKWAYLLDRADILNAVRAILERWGNG